MNFKRFHESRNLIDLADSVEGYILADGTVSSSHANLRLTNYIEIPNNTNSVTQSYSGEFTAMNLPALCFFDSGKNYISGEAFENEYTKTFSVPTNAKYMRTCFRTTMEWVMLNTGSTPQPYEPYSSEVWHDIPHYIHNTSTDTITTLPADIYANDTTATVGLKGQMVQSGSPSPSSIIIPSECGDKTANLFDEVYPNLDYTIRYLPIYVGDGTFTASTTTPIVGTSASLWILQGNVSSGAALGNSLYDGQNRTVTAVDGYITIAYRITSAAGQSTVNPSDYDTMLNAGETALPYDKYGQYKIPILSGGVTTPVYLGETQSTRRIKKIVFDGTEEWTTLSGNIFRITVNGYLRENNIVIGICSHFKNGTATSAVPSPSTAEIRFLVSGSGNNYVYFTPNNIPALSDWRTFLSSQYSAGTPVCVWYVLATQTTGIVNEPIRKIGTYADEVSDITIPTIAGANTLSVDTTLQPSEVSVNYHGWHPVADVHEYDSNYTIATMQALTIAQLQTHTISDLQGGEWS